MNSDSEALSEFLSRNMPRETSYIDVAYTCQRIFCTLEGLPPEIANLALDKDAISEAFANWTRRFQSDDFGQLFAGAYSASWHRSSDKGHWIQVISSILSSLQPLDCSRPLPFNSQETEQSGPDNSRPCGTSVMSPADPASRAGDTPEASGSI